VTITDQTVVDTFLDDVHALESHAVETVVAVRADAAERIHALEVKTARLAEERDAERARADLAEKAGVDIANALTATMRREIQLTTRLRAARENVRRLEQLLNEEHASLRRTSDMYARLGDENLQLRTENRRLEELRQADGQAKPGRFRRRNH
jgi:hypothetical protein